MTKLDQRTLYCRDCQWWASLSTEGLGACLGMMSDHYRHVLMPSHLGCDKGRRLSEEEIAIRIDAEMNITSAAAQAEDSS